MAGTGKGRRCDLRLGRYLYVGLAQARRQAFEYRKPPVKAIDPTAPREEGRSRFRDRHRSSDRSICG